MSRTPKGNNASALANGNRLAADLTHGVTCSFAGGCRVFDPNISKDHEGRWHCERHGGANNHARANAKDDDCRDGLPGAAANEGKCSAKGPGKVSKATSTGSRNGRTRIDRRRPCGIRGDQLK